jgi:hypothetical protein
VLIGYALSIDIIAKFDYALKKKKIGEKEVS